MCLLPVDLLLASVFGEGRACSSGRQYQAHTKNRGRAPLLPGCHTAVAMRNNSLLYPCPASHRCSSSGTTRTNTQRCQRLYCVHTDLPSKASHLFDCLDLGWLEVLVSVHRPGPSHLFYCLDPG